MGWLTDLGRSTDLLWDVLDALKLPAFTLQKDLGIKDCNRSVSEKLHFSGKEITGVPVTDIIELSEADRDLIRYQDEAVVEGRCLQKDRESFAARITFVRQPDGAVVVIEDISGVKKIASRAAQRSREISTYNALSETLCRSTDLKEVTTGVLNTLVEIMQIDSAWMYLIDDDREKLHLWNFKGVDEKVFDRARSLKPYECFIGRVLSSEKALLVKNASDDPRITHIDIIESGFKSIAGVPLTVKDVGKDRTRVVGVLGVGSLQTDRFTSLDMKFLSSVGNQLGVAIENIRLMENLKDKMKQIELINEITGVVNSSLSIGHIFRLVVSEISKTLEFDRASINLLDEERNVLNIFALDTTRETQLTKGVTAPLEGTSSGWVTQNQRPWINYDLQEEMEFGRDSVLLKEGIRSTISVPLFKDRPLGALNFDSIEPEKYSDRDLDILMPVAKSLSIALENALLFEEISKEKREWEKTFDAITDMVWIEDRYGKVLRVNRMVLENSGKPEFSLVQKGSDEIFKALQIPGNAMDASDRGPAKQRVYGEVHSKRGRIYHYWTYPLVDSDGAVYGVVNYLRDVTEQKDLEGQLFRSEKLASLGTLSAGIAHEINNPLGIIAGYSEALLDRLGESDPAELPQREVFLEYLETINKEIFRCKDILKSLLDFARPSTGTCRRIDINELIKEVLLLVKHKASTLKHAIDLRLNRDIPSIKADPGALRQLFINIIMNSMSFMHAEGVITISTDHDHAEADRGFVKISIADDGVGIDERIVDKIFDPFFTTKPVGEGTGLGLSISHRIVAGHKGTITAENNRNGGTTFHIRLPAGAERA